MFWKRVAFIMEIPGVLYNLRIHFLVEQREPTHLRTARVDRLKYVHIRDSPQTPPSLNFAPAPLSLATCPKFAPLIQTTRSPSLVPSFPSKHCFAPPLSSKGKIPNALHEKSTRKSKTRGIQTGWYLPSSIVCTTRLPVCTLGSFV